IKFILPLNYNLLPINNNLQEMLVTNLKEYYISHIVRKVYNAVGRVTGALNNAIFTTLNNFDRIELSNDLNGKLCEVIQLGLTQFECYNKVISRFDLSSGLECCRIVIQYGLPLTKFIITLAHEL